MLIPHETYEVHKVHIGALQKSADMKPFLSAEPGDGSGLHLIDLEQTDSRMRIVAQFLNRYDPTRILVVSARQYVSAPPECSLRQSVPSTSLADSSQAH